MRISWLSLFCGLAITVSAQTTHDLHKSATYNAFSFRGIGPALTSGRIADLVVNPDQTSEWYLAVASGGVWKTTNSGTTFSPIFDGEGSYSTGCITLDPNNPHVVWVGTGENNNQRSVAYGDGIYRSSDGGKSWKNMGLKESEHIGMIRVDPRNSNVVYAAAYGPLWSAGGERGLYKTTDAGTTWERVLEVDEHTGINEVHFDPRDPDILYATAHQRRRHVWTYISGGPGSTIYKSTDGGATWNKIEKGLPAGKMGRVGMAVSPANPDILYAIIEAEDDKGGFFRSTDRGASWSKQNKMSTSGNYYQEVYCDPKNVDKLFIMDTYCHYSLDGGKTFQKLNEKNKHVDNHCMWINPDNTDHYLMGCDGGLYETFDNATSWKYFPNLPITQFYRVTADNSEPFYHIYGGTQDNFSLGGPSQTRKSSGIDNYDWFVTNTGDGFESQIDPENPNIVYAQSQYGWLVRYDKQSGQKIGIKPRPGKDEAYRWNWDAPLIISPHQSSRLYFAANKVFRSDDRGNSWTVISPDLSRQIDRNKLEVMGQVWGMDAVMKNKSTSMYGNIVALSESPKQQGLLYAGTDDGLIQITEDDGANWTEKASFPDVPERTYVNDVKASLHDVNTVYAVFNNHKNGDFKPYVLKSSDQGKSWKNISGNLPERGSVYSLAEDHEKPGLLFAGTEFGLFVTLDDGEHWTQLKSGLPTIAIRDVDIQRRENDLVLASFGRGFYILDNYAPLRELSDEMLEKDFVVFSTKPGMIFGEEAKYGYAGSGFQGAQFYTAANPKQGVTFTYFLKEGIETRKAKRQKAEKELVEKKEPVPFPPFNEIHAEETEEKPYLLFAIADEAGNEIYRFTTAAKGGIHRVVWNGRYASNNSVNGKEDPVHVPKGGFPALPGTYQLSVYRSQDGQVERVQEPISFELKWLQQSDVQWDPAKRLAFQQEIDQARRNLSGTERYLQDLQQRLKEAQVAARKTPNISIATLNKLRQLEPELDRLHRVLHGDASKSKREFETPPGLLNRVGLSVWYTYNNQIQETTTQRFDLSIALEELKGVNDELKSIGQQVKQTEKELIDAGAPYLRGYLPEMD